MTRAHAGSGRGAGGGWESWSRASEMGPASRLEKQTQLRPTAVPSGTGQGSLAQVPWHLDGTRGWRAGLNIAWGPCLLLGPSQGNNSSEAPDPSAAFIPLPPPPISDPSHLPKCVHMPNAKATPTFLDFWLFYPNQGLCPASPVPQHPQGHLPEGGCGFHGAPPASLRMTSENPHPGPFRDRGTVAGRRAVFPTPGQGAGNLPPHPPTTQGSSEALRSVSRALCKLYKLHKCRWY